jgi:hypothetical protein
MDDKDSITFDDIEIDLSSYGAAQASTMTDTLDTITLTGPVQYSNVNTITLPSPSTTFTYSGMGATVGGITTINNINSNTQWATGTSGYTFNNTITPNTVNISTTGIEMAAGTDIKIDGHSLKEFMKKMEQRLAILVPDPKKLEKFEALKKAYEHYKTMESLCFDEPIEEPEQ